MKEALNMFGAATGQNLNFSKCSILFGDSCPTVVKEQVRVVLDVTEEGFEDKYLGLPTPEGRMPRGRFQSLQNEFDKEVNSVG